MASCCGRWRGGWRGLQMAWGTEAFEAYRRSAGPRTALWRLGLGVLLVILCTFGVAIGGYLLAYLGMQESGPSAVERGALLGLLSSFAGVWLGALLAMRLLHREPLTALLGVSRGRSGRGFVRGALAVMIVSLMAEIVGSVLDPDLLRGSISLSFWLICLVPAAVLVFVQAGGEELFFRGYLMRGLASRFQSPFVWMGIPNAIFVFLHWSPGAPLPLLIAELGSIAAFTAMMVLLVMRTGALGAAMGVHVGNNLIAFLLVSREPQLSALALFHGTPVSEMAVRPLDAVTMILTSGIGVLLVLLMLLHPRSPLCVE